MVCFKRCLSIAFWFGIALVMVLYRRYGTLSTKVMLADTSKQEEYNE